MTDYPGGDTVGIVTKTPTGSTDSLGVAITSDAVTWVYGCVFETERVSEEQSETVTSSERAWVFMPYILGVTTAIDNENWLRPQRPAALAQRDYKVFGLPAVQYDMDGQPDHVWVTCEWHGG